MRDKRSLIMKAAELALKNRSKLGYDPKAAVCIFDAVAKNNIELRFDGCCGLEGMYINAETPKIVIGSYRPTGRKSFTCAHELGHHIFNHGTKIDEDNLEYFQNISELDEDEFLANFFASFYLMPKGAILKAFSSRGWNPKNSSPIQYFTIACQFGVSYDAIVNHITYTLNLSSHQKAIELKRKKPKDIRALLLENETQNDLFVVDHLWNNRAVDLQVGDFAILPFDTKFEGNCVEQINKVKHGMIYRALTPGIGNFFNPELQWSSFVRVSRKNYIGRSIYRHLEEVEDEE